MILQNMLIWKQTSLLSNGWYQRLKPYGKATKKTHTILPPTTKLSLFLKARQPNRLAYKILVGKKEEKVCQSSKKMDRRLQSWNSRKHWLRHINFYRSSFLCTKISKLIVFEFKLLHRRLATNSFLTKINLKDNEQCTFHQNDMESLIHLFWTCRVSTLFDKILSNGQFIVENFQILLT